MLALNWFNPIAWLAFRAFRADQELACDAAVTAARSDESRRDYAEALVKSVSPARAVTAAPLNPNDLMFLEDRYLVRRPAPTVVDQAALAHARVFVNGGQRGLQVELSPADLVAALGAKVASLT